MILSINSCGRSIVPGSLGLWNREGQTKGKGSDGFSKLLKYSPVAVVSKAESEVVADSKG